MQLVETVAEYDDDMLHKFLEGETPTPEELKVSLRQGNHRAESLPGHVRLRIQETRASRRCSMQWWDYLPSPLDVPAVEGHRSSRSFKDSGSAGGRFFLIHFRGIGLQADQRPLRQAGLLRIYSGSLKTGDTVMNPRHGKTERVGPAW